MKSLTQGWTRTTTDVVDIVPRGEESWHIPMAECECQPRISRDTEGRQMIIHNSWDGRAGFELATGTKPLEDARRAA